MTNYSIEQLLEKMQQNIKDLTQKEIVEISKQSCEILREASNLYYNTGLSNLSDYMYDKLSNAIEIFEQKTGYVHPLSLTNIVGSEVKDELEKVQHEIPSLSLDKTKDREMLISWLNDQKGCLSWKLDGLTLVVTYENGLLKRVVTRGNGVIGRDITHNAHCIKGIPKHIDYKGKMIVRGEALISKKEFSRINELIPDETSKYKNPRNLVSGTVQQLDSNKMKDRNVVFKAFTLVYMDNGRPNSYSDCLDYLNNLGFFAVEHIIVNKKTLSKEMDKFFENIPNYEFETDGLVLFYDDNLYGESLGTTSKFPRNGMAFKWKDEIVKTTLRDVIWNEGRTGLLTPVAIFDAIDLEGTTVSRASVHNLAILENLQLGIGDTIEVFKANMIIPQIANNLTKSNTLIKAPHKCPFCNEKVVIEGIGDTKLVYCKNQKCGPKQIEKISYFCSRDAMDIVGLSTKTIETFYDMGLLKGILDIFELEKHKELIVQMDGFGEKSFENMTKSINKAKKSTLVRLLNGLGIDGVGLSNSKIIAKYVDYEPTKIQTLTYLELSTIDGIGDILANNIIDWFGNEHNVSLYNSLLDILTLEKPIQSTSKNTLEGKTFVITGKLIHFSNRKVAKDWIENRGGKLTDSISNSTYALITNDTTSNSGKNKKAKELGILVISEEELLRLDV